jgi:pimeloyl-ACP methyl ester carboxylesterase
MSCDVLDTIAWAKQHGFEKISIVASSFSGALVSLALAYAPTPQLEKLIFLNPVLDFQNVFTSAATAEMAAIFSSENQLAAFKNGSFYPVPHFEMTREFIMDLKSINVQQAYQNITIPHLVVHGTADELVSFERAEEVTKSNKNSTFLAIEGGMHAFTISGHEAQIQEIIIDWLRA